MHEVFSRKMASIIATAILIHMNVSFATDFWNGEIDPLGPRKPNKEKLKRDLEFAEECRKFIPAPQQRYY